MLLTPYAYFVVNTNRCFIKFAADGSCEMDEIPRINGGDNRKIFMLCEE